MRVAYRTIYQMIKYNISHITERMQKLNTVVASGKRINDLSDDPVGLSKSLHLKSKLDEMDQIKRNLSFGKSWLSAAETALNNVQELLTEAKGIAIEMSNSTVGQEERRSAAKVVDNILKEIIVLANSNVNGRYIFSGQNTDTAPFDEDGNYRGNNSGFTISAGKDITIQIGYNGQEVFGTIFNTLKDFRDSLENNDIDGIQQAIGDLNNEFDNISKWISDVGAKTLRIETKENILDDLELTDKEMVSELEDADIAEAVIDLENIQLAYKAALASSSKIMKLTLLDYIR